MRRSAIIIVVVAALAVIGFVSFKVFADNTTVTGQLVDLSCYTLDKQNTGLAHRGRGLDCARACAKEGYEVGLLATDGKVYHITGGLAARKNAKLWPHMSETVTITGQGIQKDGQMMLSADSIK